MNVPKREVEGAAPNLAWEAASALRAPTLRERSTVPDAINVKSAPTNP
jgi:hypothetical protein